MYPLQYCFLTVKIFKGVMTVYTKINNSTFAQVQPEIPLRLLAAVTLLSNENGRSPVFLWLTLSLDG